MSADPARRGDPLPGTAASRAKALFAEALERPAGERAQFLIDTCADAVLRAEVEALLFAHELCEQASGQGAREPLAEQPGQVIGNYKLLQEIGAGGFGVVWMAEQLAPVRRKVALKVLKLGMDTRQVVARFEAERQALALMDHPGIAKVFDGGATERGRPYFVMELVRGEPITRYCDQAGLSIAERLRLFLTVCQAVQHAHTKGIIHRDLKPGNVLVTLHDGMPVPKVIDFGIAKATHRELTTKTLFTEFRQLLGTPEYMAPEQAELSGLDIDTRADIYSLGVLLYELLTGSRPFELKDAVRAGCDELLRRIKEEDPQKPSTRASTQGKELTDTARTRRVHPKALARLLRGDLDWMVMKALEKDRGRRYETAAAFADDVQRHLDDLPVRAGPPGRLYSFTKYLRRHRVGATAVTAVFLSLVAGLGAALAGYADARDKERLATAAGREANEQRAAALRAQGEEKKLRLQAEASEKEAKTHAKRAEAVLALIQRMLSSSDPHENKGPNYKVRELLEDFERERAALKDEPEVDAALRRTIGIAYLGLGLPRKAEPHLEAALATRQGLFGEEHATVAESVLDRAHLLHELGDYRGAEACARRALGIYERLGAGHEEQIARALDWLSDNLRHLARYPEAWERAQRAIELRRRLGEEHPEESVTTYRLLLLEKGDIAGAEKFARATLDMRKQRLGNVHLDVADSLTGLASCLEARGDLTGAEACFQEALAIRKELLDDAHPLVANNLSNIANIHIERGDHAVAEGLHRDVLTMRRTIFGGDEHPDVAASLTNLACVLNKRGFVSEAEKLHNEALVIVRRFHGEDHPLEAAILVSLGTLTRGKGDPDGAERLHDEALAMYTRIFGEGHPSLAGCHHCLAVDRQAKGDLDGAERHLRLALATYRKLYAQGHPDLVRSLRVLGVLLLAKKDLAGAEQSLREALKMAQRILGDENPDVAMILKYLGEVRRTRPDLDEAERFHEKALAMRRRLFGDDHSAVGDSLNHLGLVCMDRGDHSRAAEYFRRALEIDRKYQPKQHPDVAALLHNLGCALEKAGHFADAEQHIREGIAMSRACLGDQHETVATALHNLGHVLLSKGELDEAEKVLRDSLVLMSAGNGRDHFGWATNLKNLGRVLHARKRFADAEQFFDYSLAMHRRLSGKENREVADLLHRLGNTLAAKGDSAQAAERLGEALALTRQILGDGHSTVSMISLDLASAFMDQNDLARAEKVLRETPAMIRADENDEYAELVHRLAHVVDRGGNARPALELFQKSLEIRRALGGTPDAKMVEYLQCLADAAAKTGAIDLAKASHREVIALRRRIDPASLRLAERLALLGSLLLEEQQHAEAEPVLRECLEIRTAKIPDDPLCHNAMSLLGGAVLGQGRYEEAETLLVEGYEKMAADFAPSRRRQALERLVKLYESWGRPAEAETWKARLAAVAGKGQ